MVAIGGGDVSGEGWAVPAEEVGLKQNSGRGFVGEGGLPPDAFAEHAMWFACGS